ncbi:putative phosphoenolpyruvate synthase [Actinoplanes sp. NBRC 14428]|nr:putative phosphoenolpyruvate synthase [Actinoplanes sp. NBRC 14428]
MNEPYTMDLGEAGRAHAAAAGGKAANLGELARIDGVGGPAGFCVTTAAFRRAVAQAPAGAELAVPDDVAAAVTDALSRLGATDAYAVRSSATAEDLPTASFAGQHDTYLNVVGTAEVLRHLRRCWASLFTERAVAYRRQHGIDDRTVSMAVIVQRMVFPEASGVLFTADPVTGNRRVATVDASFGLGEALVSGLVNPDVYAVRDGAIVARTVAAKQRAVRPLPGGGTREEPVEPHRQTQPALTDAQVLRLVELGRRIEAHFGSPQDIEWCLAGDGFRIVQSRPITTLFPVPAAPGRENRVYLSVGHQQMMTDAMRPLGISLWQLTAMAPMLEAGGRLFVDATGRLAAPGARAAFLTMIGRSDPLTRDALETILARGFVPETADPVPAGPHTGGPPDPVETDPAVVAGLIARSEAAHAALRQAIRAKTGPALFDYLREEAFPEHKRLLGDPLSIRAIMAGMDAAWWLNDRLREWLGERNAADTLTLSAPGNITSEMGLALLDVADAVRPHPEVVAYLREHAGDDFLDRLPELPGGAEARRAVEAYLDRYGMRCVGEIDITRPRWSEEPATLVPLILDNVRNFAPGAARQRFARGRQTAQAKAREVLARVRALPDGERKAGETERMIDRVRTFAGYREYPKYAVIARYLVYKRALMAEADSLVRDGVLAARDDVFFLTFGEFHDAVRTRHVDGALIRRRREDFRAYRALTPPRVLTSEGEALNGAYRRDDVPPGALTGLPVSAGTVEGRARVILDLSDADLAPGDILVTAHTDPSWTPLFVAVAGLVTEIGGLMTHGAVIAREYGLPAVVSVTGATRLIPDGRRIRVHGTDGYVELLPEP